MIKQKLILTYVLKTYTPNYPTKLGDSTIYPGGY